MPVIRPESPGTVPEVRLYGAAHTAAEMVWQGPSGADLLYHSVRRFQSSLHPPVPSRGMLSGKMNPAFRPGVDRDEADFAWIELRERPPLPWILGPALRSPSFEMRPRTGKDAVGVGQRLLDPGGLIELIQFRCLRTNHVGKEQGAVFRCSRRSASSRSGRGMLPTLAR